MHRFGLRCLVLVILLSTIAVFAALGCEDENKNICCECTCFTIVNSTTGEEDVKTIMAQGKNISCEAECRSQCSLLNWEIRYHAKVKCPEGGGGGDTAAQ